MKIDIKPLPQLSDVISIVRNPAGPEIEALAAPWMLDGDEPFWLSRSSWGMAALVKAVAENVGRDVNVWLPEYFCDQALWQLRQQPSKLVFYPVDERAWPDWQKMKVEAAPPDLFFLVHFYGHVNDVAQARLFCDEVGALLIEDATHAIGPDAKIGSQGDFVFYSPWKFFQIPNGALMLVRPRAAHWLGPLRSAVASLGTGVSTGLKWLKESLRRTTGDHFCVEGDFFKDPLLLPMPARPRAAPFVRSILAAVDMRKAAQARRANDAALRNFLSSRSGWQPFDPTPAQGPLRSTFRLSSPELADAAHLALRRVGLRAEGWPRLPPEVSANSHAVELRRTVLSLPCHQGLSSTELIHACTQI